MFGPGEANQGIIWTHVWRLRGGHRRVSMVNKVSTLDRARSAEASRSLADVELHDAVGRRSVGPTASEYVSGDGYWSGIRASGGFRTWIRELTFEVASLHFD